MIIDKLSLVGMQLLAKYKENFDVSSEGPINESLLLLAKAGERQPQAPGKIGEQTRPPPRPSWLSHWWQHQSLFFNRNHWGQGNRQRITYKKSSEDFGANGTCGVHTLPYQQKMGVINLFSTGKYLISSHNW